MKLVRGLMLATACVSFVSTTACDKAKDALKDALGVDQLTEDEIGALLDKTGWKKDDPRFASFKIHGGIKITEKFSGNLGEKVDIPVPAMAGADKAGDKVPSIALLKVHEFSVNGTPYTRFKIVSIGRYDAEASALKIDGGLVNQFLDEKQQLNKENQPGEYILVQGTGASGGFAYLKGTTSIKKNKIEAPDIVGGALVFTDGSPFVAESGATSGKYFLAIMDGDKGTVTGFKAGLGASVTGTPEATSTAIPYAGILEQLPEYAEAQAKADEVGGEAGAKGKELLGKANTSVTNFGAEYGLGWTLVDANLLWTQPPQAAPETKQEVVTEKPPLEAEKPAEDTEEDSATSTATSTSTNTSTNSDPTEEPEAPIEEPEEDEGDERDTSADQDVVRGEDPDSDPQVDLGCNGFVENADGSIDTSFLYDGSTFSTAVKGWRFQGDVRATMEGFFEIFGSPAETNSASGGRYLDLYPGACVLTTGDQLYQKSGDAIYQPGPDGEGRTSEMWQQVKVPTTAKAIQVRVAFLSQEYPKFVGTKFNDSFFIKFDESLTFIASGNLNEIAGEGKTDADGKPIDIAACKTQKQGDTLVACGEWEPIVATDEWSGVPPLAYGHIWDITSSTQAQKKGLEWRAMTATMLDSAKSGQAYYGMVKPRIICKDLDSGTEVGKTLTLRFNVTDAGDNLFDSALAVDSVVFTTFGCSEESFTGEPDSRASEL